MLKASQILFRAPQPTLSIKAIEILDYHSPQGKENTTDYISDFFF